MRAELSSGDLARATGATVRTIRFYEEEGLLRPTVVSEGGHRRYTEDDLERLRLITDLRDIGLSLCDIRAILELRTGCRDAAEFAARLQQTLTSQLEQAQRRLERLRRMKRELLDALGAIQDRLAVTGGHECPCRVAEAEGAPRIVRVLAGHDACCGHAHDEAALAGNGDAEHDAPGASAAPHGPEIRRA